MSTSADFSLTVRGHLLTLETPKVMGIINATPDSFFSGSKYSQEKAVLTKVEEMVTAGVSIIDVGGMSSRPGADRIAPGEERSRVIPFIAAIHHTFPDLPLSVDTWHSEVAEAALDAGAGMINDISAGLHDPRMWQVAAAYRSPYVMMHMQGTPDTMQVRPSYGHVVEEVIDFLSRQIYAARQAGLQDVIIDPGFGFGKSVTHNYQLLMQLEAFQLLDCPILVGLSRKSMINKIIGTTPDTALNGTTVLHTLALERGAHLLRVHDVEAAQQAVSLVAFARQPEHKHP